MLGITTERTETVVAISHCALYSLSQVVEGFRADESRIVDTPAPSLRMNIDLHDF